MILNAYYEMLAWQWRPTDLSTQIFYYVAQGFVVGCLTVGVADEELDGTCDLALVSREAVVIDSRLCC